MSYDASDRKDVRRAEKASRSAESARIAYVRHIMSDSAGREWMHGLLETCNIFHTPFVAGHLDVTAHNCGAQNVGLVTFKDIVLHCPDQYVLMMKEQATKENTNGRRTESTDTSGDNSGDSPDLTIGDTAGGTDSGRNDQGSEPDPASYVDENGFIRQGTKH